MYRTQAAKSRVASDFQFANGSLVNFQAGDERKGCKIARCDFDDFLNHKFQKMIIWGIFGVNRVYAQVRVQECGHARWGGIGIAAIRRRRPGPRGRFFLNNPSNDPSKYPSKYFAQNTEGSRHLVDFTIGNEKKGRTIAMDGGDVEENDCFQ